MKKLYEDLGVQGKDSAKCIKKAYYDLSKEFHPDKGGDPERFKEIAFAYEILGDPEKRAKYDAGEDPEKLGKATPIDPDKARVREMIMHAFEKSIPKIDPETDSLIESMEGCIQNAIDTGTTMLADIPMAQKRFKTVLERLGGDSEYIKSLTRGGLQGLKKQKESLDRELRLCKVALKEIEKMKYRTDDRQYTTSFDLSDIKISFEGL